MQMQELKEFIALNLKYSRNSCTVLIVPYKNVIFSYLKYQASYMNGLVVPGTSVQELERNGRFNLLKPSGFFTHHQV
jgi:hypothetical protein